MTDRSASKKEDVVRREDGQEINLRLGRDEVQLHCKKDENPCKAYDQVTVTNAANFTNTEPKRPLKYEEKLTIRSAPFHLDYEGADRHHPGINGAGIQVKQHISQGKVKLGILEDYIVNCAWLEASGTPIDGRIDWVKTSAHTDPLSATDLSKAMLQTCLQALPVELQNAVKKEPGTLPMPEGVMTLFSAPLTFTNIMGTPPAPQDLPCVRTVAYRALPDPRSK